MKHIWLFVAIISVFYSLPATACDSSEYRQFDFWLGDWEVKTKDGKLAGYNKITKHLGECTLFEDYDTPSGFTGTSFNIYDKTTEQWHQTWVDNTGLLLQLQGGLVTLDDGVEAMVMWGKGRSQQGQLITHRITWTPREDKTVTQHWQMSPDQGMNWQTLFFGIYSKKSEE